MRTLRLSSRLENKMSIVGWIIFGFIVGLIARAIMPGQQSMSLVATTVLGIIGALLGGWIGQALGWYAPGEGAGFIAATVGAIIVLAIYGSVTRRRSLANATRHDRDIPRRVA
jgi:uncharacterized membrane protein YeaQ/YmgE (transglycosylase-associated protein family)